VKQHLVYLRSSHARALEIDAPGAERRFTAENLPPGADSFDSVDEDCDVSMLDWTAPLAK
jgi:hypothetical protein